MDRQDFGHWLRRERERRGITIDAIAKRTKIGNGLLQALERGDVSRWPGGIYRRSFVKSYADVVGLDADLVIANFERLFPNEQGPASHTAGQAHVDGRHAELRLLLASPPTSVVRWPAVRTACVDIAIAFAIGAVGFALGGAIGFWCGTALAALVCHVCSVLGLRTRVVPAQKPAEPAPVVPTAEPQAVVRVT